MSQQATNTVVAPTHCCVPLMKLIPQEQKITKLNLELNENTEEIRYFLPSSGESSSEQLWFQTFSHLYTINKTII